MSECRAEVGPTFKYIIMKLFISRCIYFRGRTVCLNISRCIYFRGRTVCFNISRYVYFRGRTVCLNIGRKTPRHSSTSKSIVIKLYISRYLYFRGRTVCLRVSLFSREDRLSEYRAEDGPTFKYIKYIIMKLFISRYLYFRGRTVCLNVRPTSARHYGGCEFWRQTGHATYI